MADFHYPAKPSVDEVAAMLRARTVDRYGNEEGTFTATTRPTASEATQIIDSAYDLVNLRVGRIPDADDELIAQAKSVVLLLAARLIETVYYPEQAAQSQSAATLYGDMYEEAVRALEAAIRDNRSTTQTGFMVSIPTKGRAAMPQDEIISGYEALTGAEWPLGWEQRDLDDPIDPLDPLNTGGSSFSSGGASTTCNCSMSELDDVESGDPETGEVPTWSGTEWTWQAPVAGVSSFNLTELDDVEAGPPLDGEVPTWSAGTSKWVYTTPPAGGDVTFDGGTITGQTTFNVPNNGTPGYGVAFQQPNSPTDFAFIVNAPAVGNENQESRWFMAHPEGGVCISSWTEPDWAQLHLYKYKTAQAKPILRCTSSLADGADDLFAVGKDGNVLIRIDPAQSNVDPLTVQDQNGNTLFRVHLDGTMSGPAARDPKAHGKGVIAVTSHERSTAFSWGASGEMRMGSLYLNRGDVISRVGMVCAAFSGLTLAKVAIYDTSLALVAASGDFSSTLDGQATGYHEYNLAAPWTVPASGFYYLGLLVVGTTMGALEQIVGGNDYAVNGVYDSFRMTGLSDVPNPGGVVAGNIGYFYTVA